MPSIPLYRIPQLSHLHQTKSLAQIPPLPNPNPHWFLRFNRHRINLRNLGQSALAPGQPRFADPITMQMEGTVFAPSLEGMKHVMSGSGVILTKPFLEVCKHILPVLENFGSAMSIVKNDIGGNITRLETKYASDPSKYEQLHTMVQVEVSSKTAKNSSSCTNGLLWLTRAMDFLVALFHNLVQHPDWQMSQVCSEAYSKSLKKWHGWLASSSFSVALKFAPDRKKFMEIISGSGDINADIEKFCATFSPLLAENHRFLASVGMDDLKAS